MSKYDLKAIRISQPNSTHLQEQHMLMQLTKVLWVNKKASQRRLSKSWFLRYGQMLFSLGTPDRQKAEKQAYHLGCLLRALFEEQDEHFTDDDQLSHPSDNQEDTPC